MKRLDLLFFVSVLLSTSSLSRAEDHPGNGAPEGYSIVGPFPLGKVITADPGVPKWFPPSGGPSLDEIVKELDASHVYVIMKKLRNKAGVLEFGNTASAGLEGRLHLNFKRNAGTLEIELQQMRIFPGFRDYDKNPPIEVSVLNFSAVTNEMLPLNIRRSGTHWFDAGTVRYNLDGRLLNSSVKLVHPRTNSLMSRIAPLVKDYKGRVSIAAKHLQTGEVFLFNADEVMPTASLIKLPVMIEVYQQASSSRFELTDMLTLRDKDKVPGSGILTPHFSDGATFSIRDAVRLMIAYSDNTATNMLLDKIGIAATGKHMEKWGFPNTKINAKVYLGKTTSIDPERTKKYGLGSTTAREMIGILEKLHQGKFVSPEACKQMIEHLKNCQFKDQIKRFLPPETVVAHKTGAVGGIRTDAGIMYLKSGPVALCILTADNADKSWSPDNAGNLLCGRVAKEVYDYFGKKGK